MQSSNQPGANDGNPTTSGNEFAAFINLTSLLDTLNPSRGSATGLAAETTSSEPSMASTAVKKDLFVFSSPNHGDAKRQPLVAVDAGAITLGESSTHLFIALRAAVVTLGGGITGSVDSARAMVVRTGVLPLPLDTQGPMKVLHAVGSAMGSPAFFVELEGKEDAESEAPRRPKTIKGGSASRATHYSDRLRALLERLAQHAAVSSVRNGTILLDGALTLRSRDTPDAFLRELGRIAGKAGNSIVALSKRSDLLVRGRPVRFWLDDVPGIACCRDLTAELRAEVVNDLRAERVLGKVFAARLSPCGPTFRLDLKAATGVSDAEALQQFWESTQMRLGYPELLTRAHALCSFSSADVLALTTDARIRYDLSDLAPEQPNLAAIFGPFGGRFK